MARPLKQGVDYFPLDTVLDIKFELLEAEFGLKAFAVIIKLFQMIYGQHGYYCEWNADVRLLFAKKNNVGDSLVSQIVQAALKRGIFDAEKFETYEILTSRGIQSRYIEMKKGNISKIDNRYLLLSAPKNEVLEEKTGVLEEKTEVYGEKTRQRKVKESKENKSKIKQNKENKNTYTETVKKIVDEWNTLEIYGIPKVIKMTSDMQRYKKLIGLLKDYSEEDIFKAIDNIRQSDFLLGRKGDRAWKVDFDFFVRSDKFLKILEGGYQSNESKTKQNKSGNPFYDSLFAEEDDFIDI